MAAENMTNPAEGPGAGNAPAAVDTAPLPPTVSSEPAAATAPEGARPDNAGPAAAPVAAAEPGLAPGSGDSPPQTAPAAAGSPPAGAGAVNASESPDGYRLSSADGLPPAATEPVPVPDFSQASPPLTSSVGTPSSPHGEMSVKDMFMHADPVVQGVMILLLLASVATWVVIFEKTFVLRRASRSVMLFKKAVAKDREEWPDDEFHPLTRPIVQTGLKESRDSAGRETRSDYRERVERSMRASLSGLMDRLGHHTMFLASVGSVSPFVGLFGTVWGIMHSFVGIAASGETTLAVVAPGIAEALFATAMGLVAAIPAVIAYNKITGTLKKITKEALSGIGFLGNNLARIHFRDLES